MPTCPSTQNVVTGTAATCTATYTATGTDNSGVTPTLTYAPASGTTTFAIGTTAVTVTAKDAANNQATCSFNVVCSDNREFSRRCG